MYIYIYIYIYIHTYCETPGRQVSGRKIAPEVAKGASVGKRCIHVSVCIFIYIYIYRERERDRQKDITCEIRKSQKRTKKLVIGKCH